MDQKAQMQAIVDRLAGRPGASLPRADDLDEPWRTIYSRVHKADDFSEAERLLYAAARDLEHGSWLVRDVVDLIPSGDIFAGYPSLLEMDRTLPPVDWLWPSWIPRGMLTILGAAPGAGKSFVALDLARRVIGGQSFPDGAPVARPGRVLVVDAEGVPALLLQRARAWGFDRHRLFLMLPGESDRPVDLSSRRCQKDLEERCFNLQPELVVVDSLAAATSHGETSLEGARSVLGFLASLASRFQLGFLVIHHLRKRTGSGRPSASRPAAEDLRGSSHLSAAARSVLTLSLSTGPSGELDLNGPRRLEVVKTNLCSYPPPLGLVFEAGAGPVPTLRYLARPPDIAPPTHSALCADWLLDFLRAAGRPVKPHDVVKAASQAGFPRPTLYRARRALAGKVVDVGNSPHDPNKRWAMIDSEKGHPQP
jgi:hypothetical protein